MTDEERKVGVSKISVIVDNQLINHVVSVTQPFLAQAEQEKLEYEAARKLYEEGTTGYGTSINFSILPSSPINSMPFPRSARLPKQEPLSSESESDGFTTDDGPDLPRRRS